MTDKRKGANGTVIMKRRSFAAFMISLMMCGILAGCGQDGAAETADLLKKEETAKEAEFDTTAAKRSLKEMSDALSSFLWASMMKEAGYSPMEAGNIKLELTDEEKIRAAVLACAPDGVIDSTFVLGMGGFSEDKNVEAGPDDDGFHGVSVSEKDVDKNCLDLFGTKADWGALPPGPMCDLYDAVLYRKGNDSCALIIDKEIETETDFKNQECTVTKEGGKYIGKVNVFWGYWGELEQKPGYSNYVATYELEPNDGSKYGMVITSITLSRTDDDPYEKEDLSGEYDQMEKEPFYGLWVDAFKDKADAEALVAKLKGKGLPAFSVYSCDWENLNKDPYYCVTIGRSDSQSGAEAYIDDAKKAGYPSAYVKYTGNNISR